MFINDYKPPVWQNISYYLSTYFLENACNMDSNENYGLLFSLNFLRRALSRGLIINHYMKMVPIIQKLIKNSIAEIKKNPSKLLDYECGTLLLFNRILTPSENDVRADLIVVWVSELLALGQANCAVFAYEFYMRCITEIDSKKS